MSKYSRQVSLGFDSEGRRVRRWIHADSQQELKRKERELLQNSEQELLSRKRFGTFRAEWFEAYKSSLSVSMQSQYKYAMKRLAILDEKPLKKITKTDVQKILTEYSDRASSAKLIAMTAKQILESAAADNLIPPRMWVFDLTKREKPQKRALKPSEKEAVKAADLDPRERLFVDIELYLGLRPGETMALGPHSFDLEERTVLINKAVAANKDAGILKSTKTGVTRTLPVPDVLIAELKAYNAKFRGFYYFVDEEGNFWKKGQYQGFAGRVLKKINRALGGNSNINLLDGMTMYTFRHNRATEIYYLPGVSMKKKAEYMGHSELVFIKTYSHLDNSKEETELLRGGVPDQQEKSVTNL